MSKVEEISVIGDDLTMSTSDVGIRISLRSRGMKSSASNESVLETKTQFPREKLDFLPATAELEIEITFHLICFLNNKGVGKFDSHFP